MRRIVPAVTAVLMWTTVACAHQEIQPNYVNYKGQKVYYETRGHSDKTLVFIHGWTGNVRVWKYQVEAFPEYHVIAIDLPGNGKSSKDPKVKYTMEYFADAVAQVLKDAKVSQAFVFGHSMGWAVAEVFAARYPSLCAGLGSIDGAHFVLPEDPKAQAGWVQYNRQMAESVADEKGREAFLNALYLPDTSALLKAEILEGSREVPSAVGKSMIEGVEADAKYWNRKPVDLPCLAIYSTVYQLTPKDKQDFMDQYPRADYRELQGVSHFFMLEIPYRVNQILTDYLEKNYPAGR